MTATWLRQNLGHLFFRKPIADTASEPAYDIWAAGYDHQPDNLMMLLDEEIVSTLLNDVEISGKTVADMGCGTGRHWAKLLSKAPAMLTGYDVSAGMLNILKTRYPQADVVKITDGQMPDIKIHSLDAIISTLTIAHIAHLDALVAAWSNGLKPNSNIIITDFHPEALAIGGKRTFTNDGKQISVKNYVHPVNLIIQKFTAYGFRLVSLEERFVDGSVKPYYEAKNALHVYNKFKGKPIIYGMHLKRGTNAA